MKRRNSVDVACAECGATIRAGQGVKISMISMAGSSIPMGYNVVRTIINHPFGKCLNLLFMMIYIYIERERVKYSFKSPRVSTTNGVVKTMP